MTSLAGHVGELARLRAERDNAIAERDNAIAAERHRIGVWCASPLPDCSTCPWRA